MRLFLLVMLLISAQNNTAAKHPQGKPKDNPPNNCQPAVVEVHTSCSPEAATSQNQQQATKTEVKPFMTHGEYVISGITAIYVLFSIFTYYAIKHQGAGQVSAERAWVLVTLDMVSSGNMQAAYCVTLTNHGRTPARIIEARGDLRELPDTETLTKLPQTNILPAIKLLAPNERWDISAFGIHVDFTDFSPLDAAKGKQEWYFGYVAYKTIYDRKFDPPHYTRFCYRFCVNKRWQVGGPPSYNDYT